MPYQLANPVHSPKAFHARSATGFDSSSGGMGHATNDIRRPRWASCLIADVDGID